jgi:hypothetical protein
MAGASGERPEDSKPANGTVELASDVAHVGNRHSPSSNEQRRRRADLDARILPQVEEQELAILVPGWLGVLANDAYQIFLHGNRLASLNEL